MIRADGFDLAALWAVLVICAAIAAALWWGDQGAQSRRLWLTAAGLAALLLAAGLFDVLRYSPRETHLAAVILGATLPVAGAAGLVRASRRVNRWARWLLVWLTAVVLLFGGVLLGAAILPRFLPA